ncbi:MAG: mucoidy inhibitor MuiA family protein, partial [Aureibaculum sp.]|nr:mucoidy inhibitor MuiA family protein [Aureibaculum sp.]
NVKLTLSTSDPNTNNIKPDVNPKYLNFINRHSNYQNNRATRSYNYKYNPLVQTISGIVTDESGPLPGASVIVKGTTNGTETDFDGEYSIKPNGGKELVFSFIGFQTESIPIHSSIMNVSMEEDINRLEEVVVTGYGSVSGVSGASSEVKIRGSSSIKEDYTSNGDIIEEGIANKRFEIKKLYSIPTDGDITVIEIDNYSVPATYAYFAAPVVNENVFLTAKIGNWEQYNLLPGEANVYFDGSYSGKTNINPMAISDSLTLSLGVDPNVVIKRNQLSNFKKNSTYGNHRFMNKKYEIELKNNKLSDISLILMDRIPVSQQKEIKVDDIDTGTADFNSKKGLLEWKINLPPKSLANFKFSYTIKYPKYKFVNI